MSELFKKFTASLFRVTNDILTEREDIHEAYKDLLDDMCRIVPSDIAYICIISNHNNIIEPIYFSSGVDKSNFPSITSDDPSCCQVAIETKEPVFWSEKNVGNCGDFRREYNGLDVKTEAVVPIMNEGTVVGILVLGSFSLTDFSDLEIQLQEIGQQLATILAVKFIFSTQNTLSSILFSEQENKSIGFQLASSIKQILDTPIVTVRLLSDEFKGEELVLDSVVGYPKKEMSRFLHNSPNSLSWKCLINTRHKLYTHVNISLDKLIVIQNNIDSDYHYKEVKFFRKANIRSALSVPLISGTQVVGVANIYARRNITYSKRQANYLMIISRNAADAIVKEEIFHQNENLKNKAIAQVSEVLASTTKAAFFTITRTLNHEVKDVLIKTRIELDRLSKQSSSSLTSDQRIKFETIRNKVALYADRATKLLSEFSENSRHTEYLEINELIEDLKPFFHNPHSTPPIYVRLELSKDLIPYKCVISDLRLVLHNLLSNAVKAVKKNKVGVIGIKTYEKHIRNRHVLVIAIEDNGHGIKREDKQDIYKIHYTTFEQGSGIGLFQAKQIIESTMDGKLHHESSVNKYSKFYIELFYK